MSFYRMFLAAVAAVVLATPVFADDTTTTTTTDTATQAVQPADAAPATDAQQVSTNDASATTTTTTTTTTDAVADKVNVNKATAKELMKIKGLTASKARAIVAYRKKHGDFKSVEDLASVKGFKKVKPEMLKQIEDQLSVE